MNTKYYCKIKTIVVVLIFVYFLMTMRCWIGFGGRSVMLMLFFPFIMYIFRLLGYIDFVFKKKYVVFSLIVAVSSLLNLKNVPNIIGVIYQIIPAINILFILSIPDNEKEFVFSKIVNWYGIINIVGLSLYLLNTFMTVPNFGVIESDYGGLMGASGGLYNNFLFYIEPLNKITYSFLRFNGPFIEPGDLGCVSAFILMATRFDFKKYNYLWAIMLGLVFSMSLAGYLLTFFAYIFKLYTDRRLNFVHVFTLLSLCLIIYMYGIFYNNGDNVINETILARLQFDEELGFTGNNRITDVKREYFHKMYDDLHLILWGYDQTTINYLNEFGLSAGIVSQLISIGLVGIVGLVLPFLYITLTSNRMKYSISFFVFLLLYLFQRTDTLWVAFIMSYVYGIVIFERNTRTL